MGETEEDVTITGLKIKILDVVAKQGFSILLVFGMALYFWFNSTEKDQQLMNQIDDQHEYFQTQVKSLELQIKECDDYTRKTNETVIKENTKAMQESSEISRQLLYEIKRMRDD